MHVIRFTNPVMPARAMYVKRLNHGGGFTVTNKRARARRFNQTEAAKALHRIQRAIEQMGAEPAIVEADQ